MSMCELGFCIGCGECGDFLSDAIRLANDDLLDTNVNIVPFDFDAEPIII